MFKQLLFLLFILNFIACGSGNKSEAQLKEEAKWEAVMANHDVVMPMMSKTNKVRKKLKKVLDKQANFPPEKIAKIEDLIKALDKADEGMMDWMHGFQKLKTLQKSKSHAEIIQYLKDEDVKIKKVGIDMKTSIKNGLEFLEQLAQ